MALQNFIKQAVGYLHTLFRHLEERVSGKDGPIECMGDTEEDAVLQQHHGTSHLGISKEVEDTESPDNLIVQQHMLIQHLVEKTRGMTEKITRMERVIHQLDANHQENVKMLDVAKDFFNSFKPTRAANGAIEFFSEDDKDIVQKINHMKDFFSYFVLSDRVKSKGMDKVA
ncbi:unnamed protein product [Miscanthus lutarioriparius]|uniref:Uncharacterized protein n=1 Tax=Miscanthus lutarioriparius TaxID=422564 RepID=A0A811S7N8_9POAL|nr:unnamed protein product [Miscanthus lutarioriparius]